MLPGKLSKRVVTDRLAWVDRMLGEIRSLPLQSQSAFMADSRNRCGRIVPASFARSSLRSRQAHRGKRIWRSRNGIQGDCIHITTPRNRTSRRNEIDAKIGGISQSTGPLLSRCQPGRTVRNLLVPFEGCRQDYRHLARLDQKSPSRFGRNSIIPALFDSMGIMRATLTIHLHLPTRSFSQGGMAL